MDKPGRVAQSATSLTNDPGVQSWIHAWSHTFMEIDHEILSTTILLLPLIQEGLMLGLARLIEILVNRSIYKRKMIIDMKIKKTVTFNGCSIYLFNQNPCIIASCDVLLRPEINCR